MDFNPGGFDYFGVVKNGTLFWGPRRLLSVQRWQRGAKKAQLDLCTGSLDACVQPAYRQGANQILVGYT